MCHNQNKDNIEKSIELLEEQMYDTSTTDPQWEVMVKRRNELYIELEQAKRPVKDQKQAFSNLKFITK